MTTNHIEAAVNTVDCSDPSAVFTAQLGAIIINWLAEIDPPFWVLDRAATQFSGGRAALTAILQQKALEA